ncbi:hypothetical protein G6F65_019735 [Rhizopus arrhizus]|nr:hypothetical protein G6F65_019735 [Rhizopus arrhizus]
MGHRRSSIDGRPTKIQRRTKLNQRATDKDRRQPKNSYFDPPAAHPLDNSTACLHLPIRAARTDSGHPGSNVRSACHFDANSSNPDQNPTASPANPAAPSAVDSGTLGRTTGTPRRSACICISRSLRAAPPSTRSSVSAMPLSPFMQVSSSALCSAIDSSVARAMWARVVPRVRRPACRGRRDPNAARQDRRKPAP